MQRLGLRSKGLVQIPGSNKDIDSLPGTAVGLCEAVRKTLTVKRYSITCTTDIVGASNVASDSLYSARQPHYSLQLYTAQ